MNTPEPPTTSQILQALKTFSIVRKRPKSKNNTELSLYIKTKYMSVYKRIDDKNDVDAEYVVFFEGRKKTVDKLIEQLKTLDN